MIRLIKRDSPAYAVIKLFEDLYFPKNAPPGIMQVEGVIFRRCLMEGEKFPRWKSELGNSHDVADVIIQDILSIMQNRITLDDDAKELIRLNIMCMIAECEHNDGDDILQGMYKNGYIIKRGQTQHVFPSPESSPRALASPDDNSFLFDSQ